MSALWLDANSLLWWLTDDPRLLSGGARDRIRKAPRVCISVLSPWELWIKQAADKLDLPEGFDEAVAALEAIEVVPPTLADARLAAALPRIHKDPFDRMLIAQVLNDDGVVVTADAKFKDYGVRVIEI